MPEDITTPAAYCPNCGAEYRAGFDTCADCGTTLVGGPKPADWEAGSKTSEGATPGEVQHPEPAVLCTLPWQEAWLVAGRMNDEGIDARVYPDSQLPYPGPWFPPMGKTGYDVLVPKHRLEEARKIAREMI